MDLLGPIISTILKSYAVKYFYGNYVDSPDHKGVLPLISPLTINLEGAGSRTTRNTFTFVTRTTLVHSQKLARASEFSVIQQYSVLRVQNITTLRVQSERIPDLLA